jgi:hypothetical protein
MGEEIRKEKGRGWEVEGKDMMGEGEKERLERKREETGRKKVRREGRGRWVRRENEKGEGENKKEEKREERGGDTASHNYSFVT